MVRKTIGPRDGDPSNISPYALNLFARMRDGAPPFCVFFTTFGKKSKAYP
jgi:hypothetical protein